MTLPQRFWQYARPVTVAFLLAAVLYSALVVKQPAATTNRLHSRQLGLYTHTNASYARDLGHSQYLYTRDTDYTGWPALTAASDDDYAVAKKRGELLLCWLDNPEEVPPEKGTSPWNNYDDLETWGWEDKSRDWTGGERDPGLKDIFDNSEINRDAKGDKKAVFEHTREHPAEGGQRYPATGAKYENYVYPRHGLLVAEYNYGPDRRIESLIRKGTWDTSTMSKPKLFQLSDVMWLGWAKYTTDDNRSNLQIMAVHQVGNDPTKAMMAKIMKATVPSKGPMFLGRAPQWPGVDFTPGSAEFSAFLGSEAVWALPYFLIQRGGPEHLNKRLTIEKITVFTAAETKWNSDPTFMLYLKELEDDK